MRVKKVVAGVCAAALAMSGSLALGGCAVENRTVINTDTGVETTNSKIEYTRDEMGLYLSVGGIDTEKELDAYLAKIEKNAGKGDYKDWQIVERAGEKYYVNSESKKEALDKATCSELRYVTYRPVFTIPVDGELSPEIEQIEMDVDTSIEFSRPILATNLPQISESSVGFKKTLTVAESMTDLDYAAFSKDDVFTYAIFSEDVYKASDIKGDRKEGLTSAPNITYTSSGIIESIETDGVVARGCNMAAWEKSGKHAVKVTLMGGASKTFTYNVDRTKPKVKVSRAKGSATVKATDKNGIAKIKVKNTNIANSQWKSYKKSSVKLTKKGTYMVWVHDKAGNLTTKIVKVK